MLSHADIWRAIDRLAADSGTSPSGLARRAGLDPTTFNRSKRLAAGGRPRWPSTESISKILAATGRSLAEFANPGSGGRRLPLIPGDRVADGGCFDAQGLPAGGGWAEIEFPGIGDPHAYAMRVVDDARAPVYRPGDTIVLGPRSAARVGDRVALGRRGGGLVMGDVAQLDEAMLVLHPLPVPAAPLELPRGEVGFLHRILWASQ
jgi:phage repressor protein C with HTH and peptisase S24 domain